MTVEQSGSLPLHELSDDELTHVLVHGPGGNHIQKARSADVVAHHEDLLKGPEGFSGDTGLAEEYVRRLAKRWLPELVEDING